MWYFFWSIAEIECRDSFVVAVGSLSVKISSQMLLKFAARMMSSWVWLFAGGSSGGVFIIKGERVVLCLCKITEVCAAMLVESVVTATLWNLLLNAKYILFEM